MEFLVFCVIFLIGLSIALAQIIFEDDFNKSELDNTKWEVYSKKADCKRFKLSRQIGVKSSCITSNKANLRIISGKLGITAIKENYFGAKATTALIESRKSFHIELNRTRLIIKIRVAIPFVQGLSPWYIFLRNHNTDININIIGSYHAILKELLIDSTKKKRLTSTDLTEFQDYTFIFDQDYMIWQLNGVNIYEKQVEINNPQEDSKFKNGDYNLILTINVMEDSFLSLENNCNSLLVDYIQVIELDKHDIYQDKVVSEKANAICEVIKDKTNLTSIKFIPENYVKIFEDEFNGNKLDTNKWWSFSVNDEKTCDFRLDLKSCMANNISNVEVKGGKLKISAAHHNTITMLVTKLCFKNGRIEIKSKIPSKNFGFIMETYKDQCKIGSAYGQVTIIKSNQLGSIESSILTTRRSLINKVHNISTETYSDYSIFGIEWTKTSIQWFINETVVFQANPKRSQDGQIVSNDDNDDDDIKLPFDSAFNLIISFGPKAKSFLEIDYIRVYGERSFGPETKANTLIIISSTLVMVVLIIILIVIIIILWRRSKKRLIQDKIFNNNNENVKDESEVYTEFDYRGEYEVPVYEKQEENETENHQYLEMINISKQDDYEEIIEQITIEI